MPIKPLNTDGEAFTVVVDVDHAVTSLFTLPQGCFYSVEALVLDTVTGVPLRPLIDYKFYQQNVSIANTTGKQVAAIIHLINKSYTKVAVTAKYTHGVEQSEIDRWNAICLQYKDVPKWMSWLGILDAPFQQHPSMQRRIKKQASDYTLTEFQLQFTYLAKQIVDGDDNVLSHIGYWQNYLFTIPTNRLSQAVTDMNSFLTKMKADTAMFVGDFKFTDNDGSKIGTKTQFFNNILVDRGLEAIGSYSYLPEGAAIPSKKTNLFQKTSATQSIVGMITLDKTRYKYRDRMQASVRFTQFNSPVTSLSRKFTIQILDTTLPEGSNLVFQTAVTTDIVLNQTYTFNVFLQSPTNEKGRVAKYAIRIPDHMYVDPVFVECDPDMSIVPGHIDVELIGTNNIGQITTGGFVNRVAVNFREYGKLLQPTKLYIHLKGDYPESAVDTVAGNYPSYQERTLDPGFGASTDYTLIRFKQAANITKNFYVEVIVSTSSDPSNLTAIIAQNIWYITSIPVNPYINWYFASKKANVFERITTINEGNDIYLIGKLSVSRNVFPFAPNLSIVSNGVGSAVNGIDYNLSSTMEIIDDTTIAYKVNLPLKPELESKYKFLSIKSENSNTALVWIVDVSMQTDLTGSWRSGPASKSSVLDYTTESSDFYLHLESNVLSDGTVVNVVVEAPTIYGSSLTYPASIAMFGGRAVIPFNLDAPLSPNADQYMKVKIYAPGRDYTAPPLLVIDSKKPYYDIRYVVNGVVDVDTAYEGDTIECQIKVMAADSADIKAVISLTGTSDSTTGPNSDFNYPAGSGALLRTFTANSRTWTNILLNNVSVKSNINSTYKTLTANINWGVVDGIKKGVDSSKTLNIRRKGT